MVHKWKKKNFIPLKKNNTKLSPNLQTLHLREQAWGFLEGLVQDV